MNGETTPTTEPAAAPPSPDIQALEARALAAEQRVAALERSKSGLLEDLEKLKPYKQLGPLDDLTAILDAEAARRELEEGRSDEPDMGGPADPVSEAVRLEARKAEMQRERLRKKHEATLREEQAAAQEARKTAEKLQEKLDDLEIERILRKAGTRDDGASVLKSDLLPWLHQNLRKCFKKEADGTWSITNPITDAPMRSATGGPMTPEELLELARESPGAHPWGDARLTSCFEDLGRGAGTGPGSGGGALYDKPSREMSPAERSAYIAKHGPEGWRQKTAAERRAT